MERFIFKGQHLVEKLLGNVPGYSVWDFIKYAHLASLHLISVFPGRLIPGCFHRILDVMAFLKQLSLSKSNTYHFFFLLLYEQFGNSSSVSCSSSTTNLLFGLAHVYIYAICIFLGWYNLINKGLFWRSGKKFVSFYLAA